MSETFLVDTGKAMIEALATGNGPVIVLLPSLGRGAADFAALAPILAGLGYRVLMPQPRGIGRSVGPMQGNTLHDLALDIAKVVAHDGATRCVAAGHAFGNKVARALASRHPDLVRGVIMLAGAGRAPIPEDVRLSILGSGDLSLPDDVRIGHLMKAFFAPGNDPKSWLKGWHPATKAMELEAERLTPLDEFIPAGRAPILDLQADDDTVVPPSARQDLKNEIGERVTIALVQDAGHALIPEQPQRVAEVMHGYIRSLPA